MRVLYLCIDPGIDLSGQSGGAIHMRAFIRALSALGHDVEVLCSSAGEATAEARRLNARVHCAPLAAGNRRLAQAMQAANRLRGRAGRLHPDLVRALHNLTFFRTARAIATRHRPELIYERYSLWGLAGTWLRQRLACPHILEVNAPLVYEQQRYRGLTFAPLARRVEAEVWRNADLVVAVSDALRAHLRACGVADKNVRVAPNAVDTQRFRPDVSGSEVRRALKLGDRFVIGFAGTFKPWHGVELLLDAFQQVRQAEPCAHLLLVGEGPLQKAYELQAQRLGIADSITFAGHVAHEHMPAYIAAMDVAAAPYPALDQFYYSPLKLFEYMAMGRALVASRIGQIAEYVRDGETGLLYEPGDCAALAGAILWLHGNPERASALGRSASAAVQGSSWQRNASQVVRWAQRLGGQESSGGQELLLV